MADLRASFEKRPFSEWHLLKPKGGFLLHILPKGFMRIRHYGLSANRAKQRKLAQARAALDCPTPATPREEPESLPAFWQRLTGTDLHACPQCQIGHLRIIGTLAPHPVARAPPGNP